ncbi:MAG: cell division protein FtsH [Deltaproteobacteria bacterium]|nr:MAG: cell division protein FtsH [Deltaproteobacteria bacterium]
MKKFPWARAFFILALVISLSSLSDLGKPPSSGGGGGLFSGGQTVTIPYSEFKAEVRAGNVRSVTFGETSVTGVFLAPKSQPDGQIPASGFRTQLPPYSDPELSKILSDQGVVVTADREQELSGILVFLINLLPFALIILFWVWMSRRTQKNQAGPFGSFGKVNAKLYDENVPKVKFGDVAGMATQKRELTEIVDFLKSPGKYQAIGGRVPKGILLMGPPGTGKTLLARAVAGEAGVPFFSTSASEFIEMFVGVGASRVRDLFENARKRAPSIIFIDEIDAVGRHRGAGLGGGHDEREQTLNQLLGEMDGFEGHEQVIVIAATNRPDVLDSALMRPGRFDRQVVIDMPTLDDREAILHVHVRRIPISDDVDLRVIARSTPGMSGADLENLCNEAALFAAREGANIVNMEHFDLAKDKVLMGVERPGLTSEEERRITAYHEGGHALVAELLEGMDPVHKVTILPRGNALGVTQLVPEKDRHYYPKKFLMGKLSVNMGGRAAEMVIFEDTSTGAQSDLKSSTDLAEKMVCQWGMSEKIGPVTFSRGEEHVFLGKKLAQDKTWSEETGWLIDQEIENFVKEAEKTALILIKENRDALDRIAEALLEREEITGDDVRLLVEGKALPPEKPKKKSAPEEEVKKEAPDGEPEAEQKAASEEPKGVDKPSTKGSGKKPGHAT